VVQSSLPNLGPGALQMREDPKLLGSSKESQLLEPQNQFYKTFAVDCSRTQVCVDLFINSTQYVDLATLVALSRFTGGQHYYYASFNGAREEDAAKLSHELAHFLASETGLEAVLRVRASKGIRLSAFHGNFFLRSMDLLALPNVTPDHGYGVEYVVEEAVPGNTVCFQTAVLHTSCHGERRIRVLTLALPTTNSISDLYQSVDQVALLTLLAKKAVERSQTSKLEDAREALASKCAELLGAYKTELTSAATGPVTQLQFCDNMKLFPILMLALLKHASISIVRLMVDRWPSEQVHKSRPTCAPMHRRCCTCFQQSA
jgi:protein transport protein SEC24